MTPEYFRAMARVCEQHGLPPGMVCCDGEIGRLLSPCEVEEGMTQVRSTVSRDHLVLMFCLAADLAAEFLPGVNGVE